MLWKQSNYRYSQHNILGLIIDNLSWQNKFDQLMSKLCKACCAIRAVKSFMLQVILRKIYFYYDLWYNLLRYFIL